MLGRGAELERVGSLLRSARDGRGGTLVVCGEPGIGKSAMLAAASASATEARTLSVAAVESESTLPYAGLATLLAPVTDGLSRLPGQQAAALAGALALGPPVPGDRLAVCVATHRLLATSGSGELLLCLIDDAQWLDVPSRECIAYAARRLRGTTVALLIALRDEPGWPELASMQQLRLEALPDETASALLAQTADLPASVHQGVLAAAAGNPLAILELPGLLEPDERAGRVSLPEPFRTGTELGRVFRARIGRLSDQGRLTLLIAAATGTDDLRTIWAACRRLGIDPAALDEAEGWGLVVLDTPGLRFRHPLVRSTAYHDAEPALRRRVHRVLADVTEGARSAWHLASGTVGPDARAADALDEAGRTAMARRGYATAAHAFARAAQLSEQPGMQAARMFAAGTSAFAAGEVERAGRYLEEAVAGSSDTLARARAHHLRGTVAMWGHSDLHVAVEHLTLAAQLATDADPHAAAAAYADLSLALAVAADCKAGQEAAERAAALIDDQAPLPIRALVGAALGWALILRGETSRARSVLAGVEPLVARVDPLAPEALSILLALNCRLPVGDFPGALAQASGMVDAAREAGALGALSFPLSVLGDVQYRVGDWLGAGATLDEAVALADETQQWQTLGLALAIRILLHAARGSEAGARADLRWVETIVQGSGRDAGRMYNEAAAGFLELCMGRIEAALVHLQETERLAARAGLEEPSLLPWAPDSIEAHARAGYAADAARVLEILVRQAEQTGGRWAAAVAARCEGILATHDYEPRFLASLALHDGLPMPFERARTLLAYGERLHRARRRMEARTQLHEALDLFERLGAEPWAARARAELRAAGGLRRSPSARPDELTHQEARVAKAVAAGASNHEVAAELFLSEKTVEYHLGRVFRKLGVNRRSQLAALFAESVPGQRPGTHGTAVSPGNAD